MCSLCAHTLHACYAVLCTLLPPSLLFAATARVQPDILARRDKLRADMEAHPFCKTWTYTCKYGGLDDEGKPHVTGLAQFEARILDDLWEAIKAEFAPPPEVQSELAYERSFHMHFVEERSRGFIGCQPLMNELMRFAADECRNDSLPLVVSGAPGSGKTSLVTAFSRRFSDARPNVFIIVHVVSASPSSTDIREVRGAPRSRVCLCTRAQSSYTRTHTHDSALSMCRCCCACVVRWQTASTWSGATMGWMSIRQ